MTHAAARPAFTLIEVAVALALGLVLVVGVQSLVVRSYQTHTAVQQRQMETERRTLACELLAQDLRQLLPGGLELKDGTLALMTGHALQTERLANRHAVSVRYVVTQAPDNHTTLQRCEQEPGAAPDTARRVVLADDLAAVTLSVSDGQAWYGTWPLPTPRPARGVRVNLQWRDGQQEQQSLALGPLTWRRHDD